VRQQPGKFQHRLGPEFMQDARTVDLDRARADADLSGDPFVRLPRQESPQHLALTRRQAREARLDFRARGTLLACLLVSGHRLPNTRQQVPRIVRFLDEVERPCPQRGYGDRHRSVRTEQNDGQRNPARGQLRLQLGPAHPRHPHVEHQAAGAGRIVGAEKSPGAGEQFHLPAGGLDQLPQGLAHRLVVVHDEDGRGLLPSLGHDVALGAR
jgi:hypothetical protein